jgi:hypothetical protein
MASVTLLHPEETFTIPTLQMMTKCSLFQNRPILLPSPYRFESPVSLSIFREFLSALEGKAINITDTNVTELHRLCNELGFTELAAQLSEFRPSMDFKEAEDANARGRIATLEEKANQHDQVIATLQTEVKKFSTDFELLVGEVSALRCVVMSLTVTPSQNQSLPPFPAARQPSQSVPNLFLFHSIVLTILVVREDGKRHDSIVFGCLFLSTIEIGFESKSGARENDRLFSGYRFFFRFPYFHFCMRRTKRFVRCAVEAAISKTSISST